VPSELNDIAGMLAPCSMVDPAATLTNGTLSPALVVPFGSWRAQRKPLVSPSSSPAFSSDHVYHTSVGLDLLMMLLFSDGAVPSGMRMFADTFWAPSRAIGENVIESSREGAEVCTNVQHELCHTFCRILDKEVRHDVRPFDDGRPQG